MSIDYQSLFNSFLTEVCQEGIIKTPDITKKVKAFFVSRFGAGRCVLATPDGENKQRKEFLLDVMVLNFQPGEPVTDTTNGLVHPKISAYLAVESELGGPGGTSAGPVRKNVEYDFAKLLLVRAEHKVLVFTSAPLSSESDAVKNRVEALQKMYTASCEAIPVMLIHLHGELQKSDAGNPRQIRVSLDRDRVTAFVINPNGVVSVVKKWIGIERSPTRHSTRTPQKRGAG